MADLDSFFAKKDKKKVKGRKYDSPDEIAKRLQESERKLEKELCKIEVPKKPLDEVLVPSTTSADGVGVAPEKEIQQEEEEWNEFTDDSQKDMTNLKISNLQIEDEDDYTGGYGSGEDGEGGGPGSSRSEGVWNKNIEVIEQPIQPEEVVEQPKEEVKPSLGSGGGGSYVPPHMRNVSSSPMPKTSKKPKVAPDITNAMAFPSLSDARNPTPTGPWGRKKIGEEKGFENVKHGSTKSYTDDYAPPKLSTANRFDALSDNS